MLNDFKLAGWNLFLFYLIHIGEAFEIKRLRVIVITIH